MVKLGIIINGDKPSGRLTKFFTGCAAYHVVWVDEEGGRMYDMNLLRRRRKWPYYPQDQVALFDAPGKVTVEYLEEKLTSDENVYGFVDYLLFSLRWLYHLVGKSTRNAGGKICSETINDDIWECGGETPWKPGDAPPSPCDLLRWLMGWHSI
ncbi:hypothetical protein [Sideroxydans lithotrophicus]|uniref:Uncharacterized protein n=1 Tax=Sideroxydans lithotrophicus (strain ES-1) TaxID=580332 RepID=D5CUF5_SIDLE|nr:hypothetical protein [Sideroxydans lithotrophicus]ADE10490.1 conserved hypothetical protein [Sideroxydans lithotrophicus ES-1]